MFAQEKTLFKKKEFPYFANKIPLHILHQKLQSSMTYLFVKEIYL